MPRRQISANICVVDVDSRESYQIVNEIVVDKVTVVTNCLSVCLSASFPTLFEKLVKVRERLLQQGRKMAG